MQLPGGLRRLPDEPQRRALEDERRRVRRLRQEVAHRVRLPGPRRAVEQDAARQVLAGGPQVRRVLRHPQHRAADPLEAPHRQDDVLRRERGALVEDEAGLPVRRVHAGHREAHDLPAQTGITHDRGVECGQHAPGQCRIRGEHLDLHAGLIAHHVLAVRVRDDGLALEAGQPQRVHRDVADGAVTAGEGAALDRARAVIAEGVLDEVAQRLRVRSGHAHGLPRQQRVEREVDIRPPPARVRSTHRLHPLRGRTQVRVQQVDELIRPIRIGMRLHRGDELGEEGREPGHLLGGEHLVTGAVGGSAGGRLDHALSLCG